MKNNKQHLILIHEEVRNALKSLEELPGNDIRILFVTDEKNKMLGTLSDGDIRRGLLNGFLISDNISKYINTKFKYLKKGEEDLEKIKEFKSEGVFLVPVLDDNNCLVEILNFEQLITLLPLTALIMAGGLGERLKPLTDNVPKPMLFVGGKPIIEHTIDRLISFGIKDIYISVKYLKEQIIDYFGDGSSKGVQIKYITEEEPLGTLGALSYIESSKYKDILVINSDILTNIDFEEFFTFFKKKNASMALASIPYQVNIPYAVLETIDDKVSSFSEKPTYTYYSNGGIYLFNFALKECIKKGHFFNATDLMDYIISQKDLSLIHYPVIEYWLDIGKHHDYLKAQEDIKHIKF
jgi:dTDP-glucose pyrophosphorylase